MHISLATLLLGTARLVSSAAIKAQEPIAGQYDGWNAAGGKERPYPGYLKGATLPTSHSSPAPDDKLFQTLLAAEWYVSNFYDKAIQMFNESSFANLGFPNTTYDRIREIRNNEFGHVELFRQHISDAVVKPGPCEYNFMYNTPIEFLITQVALELGAPVFVPQLAAMAATPEDRAFLAALAQVETRHGTWALMDIWKSDPFVGPIDSPYPYPLQILAGLALQVVPGSCPKENPPFLTPLPPMQYNTSTSQGHPGQDIEFTFPVPQLQPDFEEGKDYYVVYFHALSNISVPFDTSTRKSQVPSVFDAGKGTIVAVIANCSGALTEESVVAGPLLLLQEPDFSVLAGMM